MRRWLVEWTDARGDVARAEHEARDRETVLQALEPAQRDALRRLVPAAPPAPTSDVGWASRLLADLLARGAPLGPALRDVAAAAGRGTLRRELERTAAIADEGAALTELLERGPLGPALSTPLVKGMLQAGQRASRLPELLVEAAALAEQLAETRRRAQAALAYPLLVLGCAVVACAVLSTAIGDGLSELVNGGILKVAAGRATIEALAWAGTHVPLTWGLAAALLVGLACLWRGVGVPLRLRAVREAAALQALAALVAGEVPPEEATGLLVEAAPGLLPADATRALGEGAPPWDALARGEVIGAAERHALEAAARAGSADLAATLRELAALRLQAVDDRARRLAVRLGLALELGVGALLLALAVPFLGSVWA